MFIKIFKCEIVYEQESWVFLFFCMDDPNFVLLMSNDLDSENNEN